MCTAGINQTKYPKTKETRGVNSLSELKNNSKLQIWENRLNRVYFKSSLNEDVSKYIANYILRWKRYDSNCVYEHAVCCKC